MMVLSGPQTFALFVERVLVNYVSLFTIRLTEEANASPTPDPEPSQTLVTPITYIETESKPAPTPELIIALKPDPKSKPDLVHEQAASAF